MPVARSTRGSGLAGSPLLESPSACPRESIGFACACRCCSFRDLELSAVGLGVKFAHQEASREQFGGERGAQIEATWQGGALRTFRVSREPARFRVRGFRSDLDRAPAMS